jgi:hypothetical protein
MLCESCNTTPATNPLEHKATPEEHKWSDYSWRINPKTGSRWRERTCMQCNKIEKQEEQ